MHDTDIAALTAAIAALESQRTTLGDAVLELAVAPLRARLAALQRPAGLQLRQVTVLFADVVGSTAMASSLHAEDTLDMLSGALRRMAALVEAHQGRVLRFTGDGVKAAFGMEIAREDDAERAVRAGLAILQAGREQAEAAQQQHGITDFAVRVGVHTGDVALGAGIEADNTAMGAAVNIAARMEQTAPPGALRISHDTWNHVRGLFALDAQPPLQVKGVDAPMQTYLVRAALDRSVAGVERGLHGLSTPMVGRQAQLQRLRDTVARTRESRQLQSVTLLGDAGLGKSRLLREWLAELEDSRLLTMRSQPDGMLRPWGLLRSLLAAQFGVADTDSAELARRKVEEGLSPCFDGRGEEQAKRQAQLIGQLAGLDFGDSVHLRGLDPRSLRDQAFGAFRAYLQGLARPESLPVLIVEDLHWADDGSLDLLQHLLAHAAELPLALIMTGRPALLARRSDWAAEDAIVRLAPLASAQSDELVRALLQRVHDVPPQLTALVIGRAEGNPYYMEELVRRLIDDGVIACGEPHWTVQVERLQNLRLPGTLVGLLQARLDALPPDERLAARQASIIGHVFWDDALGAVDGKAPQALPALQRAAFVKDNRTSDFEGTAQRQFDHHLLHQVIYDTLLKAERRLGHSAVARWLTERTRGRGAEFLAMTGEHAERAGEVALAIDCFEQAGAEAQRRFANAAAASWLRRAATLLGESDPRRRFALLSRLQKVAGNVADLAGQDALLAEMAALLERHPDDACRVELLLGYAMLAERRGDAVASERLSWECAEVAERCGAARWAAMSQANLAWLQFVKADYAAAGRHVETSLQWADKIAEPEAVRTETRAQVLTVSAMISTELCQFDAALGTLQAVLSLGQKAGLMRLQLGALDGLANAAAALGRWDEVAVWSEDARLLGHAIGAVPKVAVAEWQLARAAYSRQDPTEALQRGDRLLASLRADASPNLRAGVLLLLGQAHLALGDASLAQQRLTDAEQIYQTLGEPIDSCLTQACAALCEARLGRLDAARSQASALLDRLDGDLAQRAAHETIGMRWFCQQVLSAAADARAVPLLVQLHADVQARAVELTHVADRERLIQALPVFRDVAAAYRPHAHPPR